MGADPAAAKLDELCARHALGARQLAQLSALLALLERDPRAPTAVREAERAIDVHLADSLIATGLESVRDARAIVDLGAGAGLPGLALAVALPGAEVRLVESQGRKCAFIEAAIAAMGVANARAVHARAEEWSAGTGAHDLAVARALAPQPVVLEYAAPLLGPGGTLVDWRGRRGAEDEDAALRAAAELGMRRVEVRPVQPFEGAEARHLHVFAKAGETPSRFPRRAGVARKRPLGA